MVPSHFTLRFIHFYDGYLHWHEIEHDWNFLKCLLLLLLLQYSNQYPLQLFHRFGGKSTSNYVFNASCVRHVWRPMPSNESFCIFIDRRIHKPIWFRSCICSFTTQIPNGLDDFCFLLRTLQMAFNIFLWLCHKFHRWVDQFQKIKESEQKCSLHDRWHVCTPIVKTTTQRKENNTRLHLLKQKADILSAFAQLQFCLRVEVFA